MVAQDQNINEAVVKIQLLERRAEGSKRQADALTDLEDQLSKARKQEKAYEEAMEQLQTDLDALEQENGRLKQSLSAPDRQSKPCALFKCDDDIFSFSLLQRGR